MSRRFGSSASAIQSPRRRQSSTSHACFRARCAPQSVSADRYGIGNLGANTCGTMTLEPRSDFVDDNPGKPVGIARRVGRYPGAAFRQLRRRLAHAPPRDRGLRCRLGMMVRHDDSEREYAYDRESHAGRRTRALDEAPQRGWQVISMRVVPLLAGRRLSGLRWSRSPSRAATGAFGRIPPAGRRPDRRRRGPRRSAGRRGRWPAWTVHCRRRARPAPRPERGRAAPRSSASGWRARRNPRHGRRGEGERKRGTCRRRLHEGDRRRIARALSSAEPRWCALRYGESTSHF
jgi:hypothetical protein